MKKKPKQNAQSKPNTFFNPLPVLKVMCGTCPFRPGSKYDYLMEELAEHALTANSRICHQTGSNAINHRTGKPERLCRGARDLQLKAFHACGFLEEPTDEEWSKKLKEAQEKRLK